MHYSLATPTSLRVESSGAQGTLVRVTGQRNGIFVIEASANGGPWTSLITNQSSIGTFHTSIRAAGRVACIAPHDSS
jgi:hypothetical protein